MSTIRLLSPQYRMARERRKEAIGFFRTQEANVNMPLAARNAAGSIARGLEALYSACMLTGDDKDQLFRELIQRAKKYGHV
jgi:hypothetical protein